MEALGYSTCGNKSGFLQTMQNNLLAFNPTIQQFSSDFLSLLALHDRTLLYTKHKIYKLQKIKHKNLQKQSTILDGKDLEPENWEPAASIQICINPQNALQICPPTYRSNLMMKYLWWHRLRRKQQIIPQNHMNSIDLLH